MRGCADRQTRPAYVSRVPVADIEQAAGGSRGLVACNRSLGRSTTAAPAARPSRGRRVPECGVEPPRLAGQAPHHGRRYGLALAQRQRGHLVLAPRPQPRLQSLQPLPAPVAQQDPTLFRPDHHYWASGQVYEVAPLDDLRQAGDRPDGAAHVLDARPAPAGERGDVGVGGRGGCDFLHWPSTYYRLRPNVLPLSREQCLRSSRLSFGTAPLVGRSGRLTRALRLIIVLALWRRLSGSKEGWYDVRAFRVLQRSAHVPAPARLTLRSRARLLPVGPERTRSLPFRRSAGSEHWAARQPAPPAARTRLWRSVAMPRPSSHVPDGCSAPPERL